MLTYCCFGKFMVPSLSLVNYASQSNTMKASYPKNQALIGDKCSLESLMHSINILPDILQFWYMNNKKYKELVYQRLKWSHMYLTTRCVMSAMVRDVVESLPPSSAPTWRVYSTTASIAGPRSTPAQGGSSTSRSSRKAPTGPERYHFGGVKTTLGKLWISEFLWVT